MKEFTKEERLMLLNSLTERAVRLLSLSSCMAQKHYRGPNGEQPTLAEIQACGDGANKHFELAEKIRSQ